MALLAKVLLAMKTASALSRAGYDRKPSGVRKACAFDLGSQGDELVFYGCLDRRQHARRTYASGWHIICHIIDDLIFVSDIFDARQAPEKMAW